MRIPRGIILSVMLIGVTLSGCPQGEVRSLVQPSAESLRQAAERIVQLNPVLKGNDRWIYRHPRVTDCQVRRTSARRETAQGIVRLTYDEFWSGNPGGPCVYQIVFRFRAGQWLWVSAGQQHPDGRFYPFEDFKH